MKSLFLLMSFGAAPAMAQQPVTIADLIGHEMDVSVTSERVVRRDGRQFPQKYQTDWKIIFESETTIRPTFVATSYTARRTDKTPPEMGQSVTLEQSKETNLRGGGHRVWVFDAGALTFLRTYEGGGMKATFAVTKSDAGFGCTANVSWPREVGVPSIVMRSFVDNAKFEVLSSRQSASSCKIIRPSSAVTSPVRL